MAKTLTIEEPGFSCSLAKEYVKRNMLLLHQRCPCLPVKVPVCGARLQEGRPILLPMSLRLKIPYVSAFKA